MLENKKKVHIRKEEKTHPEINGHNLLHSENTQKVRQIEGKTSRKKAPM
jgi:hypothetical protein